jgi:23S rRNA pseudouridine2605 synthase
MKTKNTIATTKNKRFGKGNTSSNKDSKNSKAPNRQVRKAKTPKPATIKDPSKGVRIAKYIADCGYSSRREAEEMILEGRVKVNGVIIESPALNITDEAVKIDNKLINRRLQTDLWLFHKPKQVITSNNDPQGRTTLFSILPAKMPRVVTVGRLDFNSEGLILLTNNSDLACYLESPKTAWARKYRVRVFGKIDEKRLAKLSRGITVDGIRYRGLDVVVENLGENNSWLEVTITEGKNREIRKIMAHLGLQVSRLIRTSFGPFKLGNLPAGELLKVNKRALTDLISSNDLKVINIRGGDIRKANSNKAEQQDSSEESAKDEDPKDNEDSFDDEDFYDESDSFDDEDSSEEDIDKENVKTNVKTKVLLDTKKPDDQN